MTEKQIKIITLQFHFKKSFQDVKTCVRSFFTAYHHHFLHTNNARVPFITGYTAVNNTMHYKHTLKTHATYQLSDGRYYCSFNYWSHYYQPQKSFCPCAVFLCDKTSLRFLPDMYTSTMNMLSLVQ